MSTHPLYQGFPVHIVNPYPLGGVIVVGKGNQHLVLHNLNTDQSISSVFRGNATLTGYELPEGVNFDEVQEAEDAFAECPLLEGFREGVSFKCLKKGKEMFKNCGQLSYLPSTITLDELEDGQSMFENCNSLKSLPEGITLRNVKNVNCMFANCKLLRNIPDSLDLANVHRSQFLWQHHQMFSGCYLTAQSVKNVLNALPEVEEKLNFNIGSTHNDTKYDPDPVDWRNDEEIAAMLNTTTPIDIHRSNYYDIDKGWRIYIDG